MIMAIKIQAGVISISNGGIFLVDYIVTSRQNKSNSIESILLRGLQGQLLFKTKMTV